MEIKQNAFGDYLVYKNGVNKGYTLKILGIYQVFNGKGVHIGHILKREDEYISYDVIGNPIESGDFETILFFQTKKGLNFQPF